MSKPKNLGVGNNFKQMVCIPEQSVTAGAGAGAGAIVDYKESEGPSLKENEAEDLEIKLRRIIENVPLRVNNTSGSSAGSGSGDFHQYRQMRRREQDRLARMDADYEKRKELEEFNARREERVRAAEERTAKKRAKRQKKKDKGRQKKKKIDSSVSGQPENVQPDSAEEDSFDSDSADEGQRRPIAKVKQGYQANLS
ncbi:hypothetical protein SUGI_0596480 [Cryptomeria japonica]|uniref:uncharacterized protein LOC131044224 n=1 Tax=Cryptomeria japonica TaxID=3369 RepID=UPI002414BA52|nr:uncharacterized protein LOC131044224 [Cryptomeria japonica]GLJ30155.1 hypothetical protein SUGI_0596480 [Cryptomeria japonica]